MSASPRNDDARTIGERYRLMRLLGEGGMGAVYEAMNTWTQRRVAVKLLRPEHASDQETVQRFLQEARAASAIAHPNIVDVLDMGQEPSDGSLYIVQEFLDGLDLRDALGEARRFEAPSALAMMVPVMDALAAAHSRGVLHRDVKPENIFLSRGEDSEWVPKLIDFGISKMLGEDPAMRTRTRTGVSLGTPDYMSPEQARGDTTIDLRSDVWAVGAVLYELLTGRPPFDAPSANLVIARIITERVRPLEQAWPGMPLDVCAMVNRALSWEREHRFQSMDEFRDAAMACACYPAELRSRRATARRAVPLPPFTPASVVPPVAPMATASMTTGPMPTPPVNQYVPPATMIQPGPQFVQPVQPAAGTQRTVVLVAILALIGIAAFVLAIRLRPAAPPTTPTPNAPPVAVNPPAVSPPSSQAPTIAVPPSPPIAEPAAPIAEPANPPEPAGTAVGPQPARTSTHTGRTSPGLAPPRTRNGLRAIDHYSVQ